MNFEDIKANEDYVIALRVKAARQCLKGARYIDTDQPKSVLAFYRSHIADQAADRIEAYAASQTCQFTRSGIVFVTPTGRQLGELALPEYTAHCVNCSWSQTGGRLEVSTAGRVHGREVGHAPAGFPVFSPKPEATSMYVSADRRWEILKGHLYWVTQVSTGTQWIQQALEEVVEVITKEDKL